jgi:hypothetical protein
LILEEDRLVRRLEAMTDTGHAMAGGKAAQKHVREVQRRLEEIDGALRPHLENARKKAREAQGRAGWATLEAILAGA